MAEGESPSCKSGHIHSLRLKILWVCVHHTSLLFPKQRKDSGVNTPPKKQVNLYMYMKEEEYYMFSITVYVLDIWKKDNLVHTNWPGVTIEKYI